MVTTSKSFAVELKLLHTGSKTKTKHFYIFAISNHLFLINASTSASVPVSSEIFDVTPCAHAQSNILHIKCAEKTDY